MKRRPCPVNVTGKSGTKFYCQWYLEADGSGHWGTHCGDRSEAEYNRLLREAKASERTTPRHNGR